MARALRSDPNEVGVRFLLSTTTATSPANAALHEFEQEVIDRPVGIAAHEDSLAAGG